MKQALARAIKRAVTAKVGWRISLLEAYVIGAYGEPYSDEDTNNGCDAKVELQELEVKPGDKLDCYLYDNEGLVENIEVELGAELEVVACRTTLEVIQAR